MEKNVSINKYKTAKELKHDARVALEGNYSTPVIASLMIIVVQSVLNGTLRFNSYLVQNSKNLPWLTILFVGAVSLVSIVVSLVVYLLRIGVEYMSYKVAKGEKVTLGDAFYAYKNKPGRLLLIFLFYCLIMLVAFIPYIIMAVIGTFIYVTTDILAFFVIFLIVGAIITLAIAYFLLFRYSLVNFIYFDHPEMSAIELMKESARIMNGHKLRLFRIALSFIGIVMLSMLTCGIAALWLLPYQYVTYSYFYIELVHPGKLKPDWRPFISDAGEAITKKKISLEKY